MLLFLQMWKNGNVYSNSFDKNVVKEQIFSDELKEYKNIYYEYTINYYLIQYNT